MPILKNTRHELFAQEIAKGKSAVEAYKASGYRPSRKNASRLRANEDVSARVAELQGLAARSTQITIESICRELDEANAVAKERGQASAMVSASALRAKLAGLMVERIEVGGAGDFDDCESMADVADRLLSGPGSPIEQFCAVDERDRQGLTELLERQMQEMDEYLEAIRARPHVIVRCDVTQLKPNWQELELRSYVDNPAQRRWDEIKRQRQLERKQIANGNQRRLTHGNGQR